MLLRSRSANRRSEVPALAELGQSLTATGRREGRIPAEWAKRPAKLRRKDRDARCTVKYTKPKPSKARQTEAQ